MLSDGPGYVFIPVFPHPILMDRVGFLYSLLCYLFEGVPLLLPSFVLAQCQVRPCPPAEQGWVHTQLPPLPWLPLCASVPVPRFDGVNSLFKHCNKMLQLLDSHNVYLDFLLCYEFLHCLSLLYLRSSPVEVLLWDGPS